MSSVIILGARGRFGRAATGAFTDAGWEVTEVARSWPRPDARQVALDITDTCALARAVEGHEVIVNALNPPYEAWAREVPQLTVAVIYAARSSDATVMIPGNVYNYGADMPEVLREDTAWRATTRKGQIRIRKERAYRDSGVKTLVLRGGDFIEAGVTNNWFDRVIAAKAWEGKAIYPGPRNVVHAWAWLPDMARAMVGLAEYRDDFATFEEFGFPGFALTGDELIDLISKAVDGDLRVNGLPWPLIRLAGLWNAQMRELIEMRYLWDAPHRIDGEKLARVLPDFQPTLAAEAIAAALAAWAPHAPPNRLTRFGPKKHV